MKRSLEPDGEPDITRGTLEGEIADGKVTLFRLQSGADTRLKAYVAEGEVLDLPTHTFGTVGVFAVHEMGRFYRHVLIENNFPHHAGRGARQRRQSAVRSFETSRRRKRRYAPPRKLPVSRRKSLLTNGVACDIMQICRA